MREEEKRDEKREEISLKKEAIKVLKAIIIFFIIYFLAYKLYQVSVKKQLSYDEVECIYIKNYLVTQELNEADSKMVIDCFNDLTHIKRNLGAGGPGTLDYSLQIRLKSGEEICMYPAKNTWAVEWHNMTSMSRLDAWGNEAADKGELFYWGDSPELRELWDEVLYDMYGVEY